MPAEFPRVSMVVPCWNDLHALERLLAQVSTLSGIFECIVADASHGDACAQAASQAGAKVVRCPKPSRGRQMNAGASAAVGDVLLFQHADSDLTQDHVDALRAAMRDPDMVGGAFHRHFDERHASLRWLQDWNRLLLELGGTVFGDQSIFARRSVFERMGSYADVPLMEDVEFSKRLRRMGKVVILDPPISSSARHHAHKGSWRTSIRNGTILALYHLGASPDQLHAWYYRRYRPGMSPVQGAS